MQSLLPSKFSGILQVNPADETQLKTLQDTILDQDDTQQPNPKLHVTLLHQAFPKKLKTRDGLNGKKALSVLFKNGGQMGIPTPTLRLGDVKRGENPLEGRVSYYVEIENSAEMLELRDAILEAANIDPSALYDTDDSPSILTPEEKTRVFHISLTNLEGQPGASIKYPQATDRNVVIR